MSNQENAIVTPQPQVDATVPNPTSPFPWLNRTRINLYADREGFAVLSLAVALGLLARLLLFQIDWGLGATVWAAAFAVTLIGLATDWSWRLSRDRIWIAAALAVLPFLFVLHSSETLAAANTAAILTISAVWIGTWALEQRDSVPLPWILFRLGTLFPSFTLAQTAAKWSVAAEHSKTWRSVGRGILFALPFLALFSALLSEADQRFADMLSRPFQMNWVESVPSALFVLASTCLAGTFLLGATRFVRNHKLISPRNYWLTFDLVEAKVVLGLVSTLFAAFLFVHFTGRIGIDPTLAPVAAEARAGFFQMTAVAAVTLVLVTSLRARLRESEPSRLRDFRRLVALNGFFVILILASAAIRMGAYTSTYGWTELRLNTSFAMAWTAALFAALVVTHATSIRINLPRFGIATALLLLFAMHALNPHAFIASSMLSRSDGTIDAGALQLSEQDAAYLGGLSADAIPVIDKHWNQLSPSNRDVIAAAWQKRYGVPNPVGNERLFKVLSDGRRDWRAWTLSGSRARKWIAGDELEWPVRPTPAWSVQEEQPNQPR